MAWLTVFREKSRWKPAQAYCKQAHNTLAFPADVYKRQRKRFHSRRPTRSRKDLRPQSGIRTVSYTHLMREVIQGDADLCYLHHYLSEVFRKGDNF